MAIEKQSPAKSDEKPPSVEVLRQLIDLLEPLGDGERERLLSASLVFVQSKLVVRSQHQTLTR